MNNVYIDTLEHSTRVALLAKSFTEYMGFKELAHKVFMVGMLHDIGKAKIPESVLGKQDKLSDEEYKIIKTHAIHSYDMAIKLGVKDEEVLTGILQHHERFDGSGYPNRVEGYDISIISRIISICDVFDALVNNRAYKKSMTINTTINLMISMSNKGKLDKLIFIEFTKMLGESGIAKDIYNYNIDSGSISRWLSDLGVLQTITLRGSGESSPSI